MRLDNALYIEIVFNQIAPDYLEGLLLVMPGEQIMQECVVSLVQFQQMRPAGPLNFTFYSPVRHC